MHPLHDYIAAQLSAQVRTRRVVVWYDQRQEFTVFVGELRGGTDAHARPATVKLGGEDVHLVEFVGSLFELRSEVEPLVSGDMPEPVVVYLPGVAKEPTSVLMELERAGSSWSPALKHLARNLLLKTQTVGTVDGLLAEDRKLTYADLASIAADQGSAGPSLLRSIVRTRDDDALLAEWLASDVYDQEIADKAAVEELISLVRSYLGLTLPDSAEVARLRAHALRYVLSGEFRADLSCPAPAVLDGIPVPPTQREVDAVRQIAQQLRTKHRDVYPSLADRVEDELSLRTAALPAEALGSIDTFRFEEEVLLRLCHDLVRAGRFDDALAVAGLRETSFWLDLDGARKAQWRAVVYMADLGLQAARVRGEASRGNGDARVWVDRYTADEGWHRLDQAQRRLEAWLTELDEVPERPVGIVRQAYDETCRAMADSFVRALVTSGWTVSGTLHKTQVFSEVVARQPRPVAYFFVDAMRFEMGAELKERLPESSEVSLRPAIAALPSITPVGMAALHPGAEKSFSVVERNGRLGAQIGDVFLPDLPARKNFAASQIAGLVDVSLDELLAMAPSKLQQKVKAAQVVIVRSQEIDHAGEAGFSFTARRVMDTVIGNIALAVRRLASAGIAHAVITADHGHLFSASDRDESMRADRPGGQEIDLHRRCWIGRGGTNPLGSVRVSGSELGYSSDLDLIFPPGASVFRAGGDLAFHHGGPTLQELVIPVLTVRTAALPSAPSTRAGITVDGVPAAITNRIFTVSLSIGGGQLDLLAETRLVRPVLLTEGQQVGRVGMVSGGELDEATGNVRIEPDRVVLAGFMLSADVTAARIVVLDPATDAELYRSPADIPVRLLI